MAYERKPAAIDLIDRTSLVRCLSPELMLVDPELAERARELLRDPDEVNGKGNMSALGMHEITSSVGLGLEPPLSPPVVGGPRASAAFDSTPSFGAGDLPSPPPALRPPESAPEAQPIQASAHEEIPSTPQPEFQAAPAPAPAPEPGAAPGQQPEPLEPAPLMAPPPADEPAPMAPEPVFEEPAAVPGVVQPAPELAPLQAEPELPAMAPEPAATAKPQLPSMAPDAPVPDLAPVQPTGTVEDYFPTPATPPAQPAPEPAEPTQPQPEVQPVTLTPPAAPAPAEAPAAPEAHLAPEELPVLEFPPAALEPTVLDEPVYAPEPLAPELPEVTPEVFDPFGQVRSVFRVVVRLRDGDGVEVGEFRDFGTAMEGAQEVIEQFANANGSWPFYAGRFIRPDLIVSVDVVDGSSA
jgi:hypothetical protein